MDRTKRLAFAFRALQGTAIGDAFGESFFGETQTIKAHIATQTIPSTSWEFTDDTVMSIVIYKHLERHGRIIPDLLAADFAHAHHLDVNRGYGATVRRVLRGISEGQSWKSLAPQMFDGMGSMGNGAAMRVAAIGAYFADDLAKVKQMAEISAIVTHSNPEAVSGAMAVALAAAFIVRSYLNNEPVECDGMLNFVLKELPDTDTASKIRKALTVPKDYHIETVKSILGNGHQMLAQDTVPFSLWCAGHYINDFEQGLWRAVAALGDRDTICAIVGSLIGLALGDDAIPEDWQINVERVEESVFWNLGNVS